MKLNPAITLQELASYIDAKYDGDSNMLVTGINEIHCVENGDLTFVDHPKYYDKALNSEASFILIDKVVKCPENKGLLFSEDPFRDYNALTSRFFSFKKSDDRISTSAKIGEGTIIQPGTFIGNDVIIGKNCVIHSNVSIYDNCVLGNNVIIHANTVIGSDAFYYKKRPEGYDKLKSCGRVVIHNKVEIGANCTIDRGVSSDTIIGEGTKFDNLIQVGHDTVVGKNCLFISQVGVAGCVTVENDVTLWGQVGVQKDLTIGEGAVVLGQSGIGKSLEGNKVYFGSPVQDAKTKMKELVLMKRLPELFNR